jgi:hypothetical protein
MKNITKFLSLLAIIFMAATTAFAQPPATGQFKIRYVGGATSPVGLAYNITVEQETTFVQAPGYPILMPQYNLINRSNYVSKNQTVVVVLPNGGVGSGYTVSNQYTLKDLKLRKPPNGFYTLIPAEIAAFSWVYDAIDITTPADGFMYHLDLSWDGFDTLLTITHL